MTTIVLLTGMDTGTDTTGLGAVMGINRAVLLTGVPMVAPVEGPVVAGRVSRADFPAQGITALVVRVGQAARNTRRGLVCLADRGLFRGPVEGPEVQGLRLLLPYPKTRVRQSAVLRPRNPPTLARKKSLRCRKNSCRPRRR